MTKTRLLIIITSLLAAALICGSVLSQDKTETPATNDSTQVTNPDAAAKLIVYYVHGTRRCATCKKLEAYTQEAIESGFVKELEAGTIEWQTVNTDEEGNSHFIQDYQLYTKSVILSEVQDGKELRWKNLDKIWELVRGDKEAYIKYIQDEVKAFLGEG
ncbi:MAG: nitrophenyl compound nitroreductase subunit ArsF family protein [Candidatus Zixiibacteriota bacterium]